MLFNINNLLHLFKSDKIKNNMSDNNLTYLYILYILTLYLC